MNKKDLKQLAKETAAQPVDPNKVPFYSKEDFRQAVQAIAAELAQSRPPTSDERATRLRDPFWWEMYLQAIGGQMGWISSAMTDAKKFEGRLQILADMSQAAVNYAIKRGKIAPAAKPEKE